MKKLNKIVLLPLLVLPFALSSCNNDVYVTAKFFYNEETNFSLKLRYNHGYVFTEENIGLLEKIVYRDTPDSVFIKSEYSCYFILEGMYFDKEFTNRIKPGYKLTKNITLYYYILG